MNATDLRVMVNQQAFVARILLGIIHDVARPPKARNQGVYKPRETTEEYDLYEAAAEIPEVVREWGLKVNGGAIKRLITAHIDGDEPITTETLAKARKWLRTVEQEQRRHWMDQSRDLVAGDTQHYERMRYVYDPLRRRPTAPTAKVRGKKTSKLNGWLR